MNDKEKELRIKFNNDLEMLKIEEAYESLDKLVKAVQNYLENGAVSNIDSEVRMGFLKAQLAEIEEIRNNTKDLKGIVDLF